MSQDSGRPQPSVATALQAGARSPWHRPALRRVALAALLALLAAAVAWWLRPAATPTVEFVKAKVARGDLTVTVTATGTLQPVNQVDVGSELSGIVKSVEVDFNDRVRVGQALARLDTTKLTAQVLQAEAALRAAQARVREAEANEDETRRRLARSQELFEQSFISEEALITARAAADRAVATLQSVRSAVDQARATLEVDRTNLAKAVIRSPIDGTVLARKVEPGQTVAATLQAPVLFTLAEDLARSSARVNSTGACSVAAYPGRDFPSRVADVRNAAKTVNGVVTYETVLTVNNEHLLLRPGMTGTANIVVSQVRDALLVPNAALRFSPPAAPARDNRSFVSRLLPIPPRPQPTATPAARDRRQQRVWVLREGTPAAIPVTVGASDGRTTVVVEGAIEPGLEILTDVVQRGR